MLRSKYLPLPIFILLIIFILACLRSAKFGLLRKGDYIGVSVVLNILTKFGKLAVGKHVVTAKQRHPKDPVFPLAVALSGLPPITKV